MKTLLKSDRDSRLKFILIGVLILGILFRGINLGKKVYWGDETRSSLRISGYTEPEVTKLLYTGREISVAELQKYQFPNPERDLGDTMKALAGNPEHSPLFYLLARFWLQIWGSSVAVIRSLPALLSLLIFPCAYWFCLELFESSGVAWMTLALLAISPLHLLYAQEARQYSLWIATFFLSGAMLLRALRLKTVGGWVAYGGTVVLSLYSHLFSLLVLAGHGLYVWAMERFRWTRTLTAYAIASVLGFLAFLPWFYLFLNAIEQTENNMTWALERSMPLTSLVKLWARNWSTIFFDIYLDYDRPIVYLIPPILLLIVYSFYFLIRHTPQRVWLLPVATTLTTAAAQILPDLVTGGQRSIVSRYLIPCYLGAQIAVAYLLATQLHSTDAKIWQKRFWQVSTALLMVASIISCTAILQADTWWNKSRSYYNPQIARIVNQANNPLIISDASVSNILSLSYLVKPETRFVLLPTPNLPPLDRENREIFIFDPSKPLRQAIETEPNYQVEKKLVSKPSQLWQLIKRS